MKIRKTKFQVPFFLQQALRVAQATAAKSFALAYPDGDSQGAGESIALPVPMTVNTKTECPESPVQGRQAYGTAKVYAHFGGGMSVTVWLTCEMSSFGEYWAVNMVEAKYYVCREGRRMDEFKTITAWKGEELDRLAESWGNNPRRWHDQ